MRHAVIARNYAEALLALGVRHEAVERYGELLDAVAGAVSVEPKVQAVLMSPRVPKAAKVGLLERALDGVAPAPFVLFLSALVRRGRQGLLHEVSEAYQEAADLHFNRVHASVTTAHVVDDELRQAIVARLTTVIGKTVTAHFLTDAAILGGVVVRVGDRAFDGSVRRRIATLRSRMLHAPGGGSGV